MQINKCILCKCDKQICSTFFASVQKFVYKKISEFLFHLAVSPSPSVWCALFGLASISVFSVKVKVKASKHAQRGWLG